MGRTCQQCGTPIEHLRIEAKFCTTICQKRAFNAAHRKPRVERLPAPRRPYVRKAIVAFAPIPDVPCGHELYDEARAALKGYERAELGSTMDSMARDMLQTYVLARLEGEDPLMAVAEYRTRVGRDRKWLLHGLNMTTDLVR